MGGFRPNKLSGDFIRDKADSFRRKYINPPTLVPVPIEEIIEFDLKITPWPKNGLLQKIDIDGFLSNDLKYIFIDEDIYNDPRQENRLRFTLAHEVGHFILHRKEIQACKFRSENDWIHFREEIQEEDLLWFEQQAYEFAGRLLVPVSLLKKEIESNSNKIEKFRKFYNENGEELLI